MLVWMRRKDVRKQFFFEKKHQKTFVYKSKSFWVLFFKKELLPFFALLQLVFGAKATHQPFGLITPATTLH